MTELRLEGVIYDYPGGTRALDRVDLLLGPGTSLALVGANGSGKTTLARHLDGLLRPSAGRVLIDDRDTAGLRVAELARTVGLCFQQPDRQIFGRTVRDEVEFGPRHAGADDEAAFARAKEALARVGMADELGTHPDDLGETRRKLLTIASVLAMGTPVLVLDEPTTGLDARGVELVSGLIAELVAEGRSVVGISHDMRFVARTFERVAVLERGRVTLQGTPAEVFAESSWPSAAISRTGANGSGGDRSQARPGVHPHRRGTPGGSARTVMTGARVACCYLPSDGCLLQPPAQALRIQGLPWPPLRHDPLPTYRSSTSPT